MLWMIWGQFIFNEVMNHPHYESCGEFIEFYNNTQDTVNLEGLFLSDGEDVDSIVEVQEPPSGTFSSYSVPPQQFVLILDPDYMNGCGDSYALTGNILSVDDASPGNGLSLTDSIYLITASGDTVSRFLHPVAGVPSGYSIERINYSSDMWGISNVEGGTPNRVNSIFASGAVVVDSLYLTGDTLFILVKNLNSTPVDETLMVFASDILLYPVSLDGGDSAAVGVPLSFLGLIVGFSIGDFFMQEYVPFRYPSLIINEIEYDESPEWVEIFNSGDVSMDMGAFYLMDMSGNRVRLSGSLNPGEYGVFRDDEYDDFPSLNNNYESLLLVNRWNMVFDTVYYTSSYGGEGPHTLEKINPSLAGWERSSWGTSRVVGGTPGYENSIHVSTGALSRRLNVEPMHPHPGQDVLLTFNMGDSSGHVKVLLFDDAGRLVRELFDGRGVGRGVVSFRAPERKGLYILLVVSGGKSIKGWFRVR